MLNAIFGNFCVKASWSDRMFASLLTASLELSTSTQSAIERWTFESLLNLVWTLTLPIQLSMWFRGSQFRVVLASFTVAYTIKHKKIYWFKLAKALHIQHLMLIDLYGWWMFGTDWCLVVKTECRFTEDAKAKYWYNKVYASE